jgi:3'(2'), 5'-bisphosphate nucleotidase
LSLSLAEDAQLAAELAEAAGRLLLDLRGSGLSGRELGQEGDEAANRLLIDGLRAARPGDGILSEESKDTAERLGKSRVWIVDPLDGTREYGEVPRPDWAVHVALWSAGELTAAAVALPALGEVLLTDPAPTVPAPGGGRPRIAVSRSRPPAVAATAAAALDAELVPMGSAGWKVTAVVRGEADAYVHAGGMYQWDSAAPVAVARAAGLTAVRLDGSPLVYNGPDAWLPDLLVCRPELAGRLLAAVGAGSAPTS